jgi:hypothetical protein
MMLSPWLLGSWALLAAVPRSEVVRYDGYREVVVMPQNAEQQASLAALPGRRLTCIGDLEHATALLLAPGEEAALAASGLPYRVTVADAQVAWDDALARRNLRRAGLSRAGFFDDFQELAAIESYLDELVALDPSRISKEVVGKSVESRDIHGLRITNKRNDDDNPVFVIIGTQHAREWLATMSVLWYIDRLARAEEGDSEANALIDKMDFVIVPVVNPDGFIYSWDGDRYWRKNRRGGYGVDLNRNWDASFGTGNGSASMNEEIYPGSGAFSEPESKAIADYANDLGNVVGFLDVHTPIASVLYPRSYTTEEPDNIADLKAWANEAGSAIGAVHGEAHDVFRPSGPGDPTGLGPQGGLGMDYNVDQGRYAWIFELRGPDFQIDASEIIPAAEESWAGLAVLANHLIEEFGNDTGGEDDDDDMSSSDSSMTSGDETQGDESTESSAQSDEDSDSSDSSLPQDESSGDGNSDETSEQTETSAADSSDDAEDTSQDESDDDDDDDDDDNGGEDSGASGCQASSKSATGLGFAILGIGVWLRRSKRWPTRQA